MPLPRFRIRTLMIAVAVVALAVLAGIGYEWARWFERRQELLGLADFHARREAWARRDWAHVQQVPHGWAMRASDRRCEPILLSPDDPRVTRYLAVAAHHRQLRRKYELAASRPWLPVPPDPPEPE